LYTRGRCYIKVGRWIEVELEARRQDEAELVSSGWDKAELKLGDGKNGRSQ
jgi:hypothetical protein